MDINAIIAEIQALIDQVQLLPLSEGEINSLTVKLEGAIDQLSKNPPNIPPACGKLKAFINEVEALIQSTRLDPAEGQLLIEQAEDIRTELQCHQGHK